VPRLAKGTKLPSAEIPPPTLRPFEGFPLAFELARRKGLKS
jgi:hypothetical protein